MAEKRMNWASRIASLLVVFWPCVIQVASFTLYLYCLSQYWVRPKQPFTRELMIPAVITALIGIPILGVFQLIYGLVRYYQTRNRRHLLHVICFAVIVVLALIAYGIVSLGAYVTV